MAASVVTFTDDDGWTDLGPTPLVIELAGEQRVAYFTSPTVPPNTLVNSSILKAGQQLLLNVANHRVYVRPARPILRKTASVRRGAISDFYAAPAAPAVVDLSDARTRAAGLVGVDLTTGLPISGGVVTPSALGPSTASFTAGAASGSLIATITGLSSGETLSSIAPNDGRVVIGTGNALRVGLTASAAGMISYTLTTSSGRTLTIAVSAQAGLPTNLPIAKGDGYPGNTLTLLAVNGFDQNPQWVRGNHEDDSATYTEVVGTGASYTFSAVGADTGKRVAYRGTNSSGVTKTSCGTTCTTIKFGTYVGYGIGNQGQTVSPPMLRAFSNLCGGRKVDFGHDGSGTTTWDNFVSSSGGTVHAAWLAEFPGIHMVWNLGLTVTEKAPFSGTQWDFDDATGDIVTGNALNYTASGAADVHYTTVANNLLAAGYGNGSTDAVTVRPGHEANGGWYPWTAMNACRYVAPTAAGNVTAGDSIVLNGTTITFTGTSPASVVTDINAQTATTGVTALIAPSTGNSKPGSLILYCATTSNYITIANGTGTPLTALKVTAGTYQANWRTWIAAYRRVVGIFRAREQAAGKPGYFKFMWNPNKNELKCPPHLFYPGDDVVDEISADIYRDTWELAFRYDRIGNFTKQMIGSVAYVDATTAQFAGAWFAAYSKAQGASPMLGRTANGAAKRYSWCEGGTGYRYQPAGPEGCINGDDPYYITYSLKHLQENDNGGHSGYWNAYAADYHTRSILSSNVPNVIRNASNRSVSQWLQSLGPQTFTVEGQLPAGLWDEMPQQLAAFVRWFGTEAAQAALGTPAVIPVPTITCSDVVAAEGGVANFVLTLSSPLNDVVEVITQTQAVTATGGTATRTNGVITGWSAGADYETRAATRSYIQAGVTSYTISVPVALDAVTEDPETFRLLISAPTTPSTLPNKYVQNYVLGTTQATCTIHPGLSIADTTGAEGGNADFTITLPHAVSYPVTVTATTREPTVSQAANAQLGQALAGSDFVAKSETFTFAPGETTKTFSVVLPDDNVEEAGKLFYADLSNVVGGAILRASGACIMAPSDGSAWQSWTGLVGHFDAADASTLTLDTTATTEVTSWKNKATGKGDLTPIVAGNRPKLGIQTYAPYTGAAALNMPGVQFQPGDSTTQDFIRAAAASALSKAIDGTKPTATLIMVGYLYTTNFAPLLGWSINNSGTTGDTKQLALIRSGSNSIGYRTGPSDVAPNVVASPNFPGARMFMVALAKSPTAMSMWTILAGGTLAQISGAPGVLDAPADLSGTFVNQEFGIGSVRSATAAGGVALDYAMDGIVHEVVVSKARQTDAEIRAAMTGLATKWKFGLT